MDSYDLNTPFHFCSYMGELYEFDMSSKPSWKKHIWSKPLGHETFILPCRGHVVHGLVGAHSLSIFLLTKVN